MIFKAIGWVLNFFFGAIGKTLTKIWNKFWTSIFGRVIEGGVLENYTEIPVDSLMNEYGMYLMEGESIDIGYKIIRDAVIFTDRRIVITDSKGLTGTRMSVKSVPYYAIVEVTMESAGVNLDDAELKIKYIKSPNMRGYNLEFEEFDMRFPTNYDVQSLYTALQSLAYENCIRLNGLD